MVLGPNGSILLMEEEEEDAISWTRSNNGTGEPPQNHEMCFGFKSMLEPDWYLNHAINPPHQDLNYLQNTHGFGFNPADSLLLLQPMDSSSSCSPSRSQAFLPHKSCFSSLLTAACNNPFENGFDFSSESGFLGQFPLNHGSNPSVFMGLGAQNQMGNPDLSSSLEFPETQMLSISNNNTCALGGRFSPTDFEGLDNNGGSLFANRAKVLRPLEVVPSAEAQPTLFQKRAALRQGSVGVDQLRYLKVPDSRFGKLEKMRKNDDVEIEEGSMDMSSLNYDSDDPDGDSKLNENAKSGENNSNAKGSVTGGNHKGKKKGLPAKNLMAERRRRKKLNDRLYMLRSIVPKISKMDRASILGDAIDYLKELLQKINDLHNELESTSHGSLLPPSAASSHPTTPTTLPSRVKDELCLSSLPSPNSQSPRVEVRVREGRAVNIHMFCARRPGLLLSTMRAMDNLGLDIQQAVISCFNGFALDVFRAEQCREDNDVLPEQIKAVLLDSAGFHGMM